MHGRPIIGIGQSGTNVVGANAQVREILGHLPANHTDPVLDQGDRIVAVDGEPVNDYRQLTTQLARRVDQDLVLHVERPPHPDADASQTPASFSVTLPANPVRWLGLHLTMGPITSIQQGSVGELAGFKLGDRLIAINGQPIKNPMEVPEWVRRLAGQSLEVQIERPGVDAPLSLQVTPVEPSMLHVGVGPERPVPIESLGIAFAVENTVMEVVPGSPAAEAGIAPGDVLQTAEFATASPEAAERERKIFGPPEPMRLGQETRDWPRVHDRIQVSLPDTRIRLTYQRGDHLHTAEMQPVVATDWYYPDRGLKLTTLEEVHQVNSWATAFGLGWRETVESMRQVYFILFRLVTGQLSPMNLGGPASIATMAGLEASESTARLLVFLTLLSANLAVVNFLPIPVLDGGHAMFLLYEGIFRKPINERVAFGLTMVGFCFVLGLMLFVIGLDVWRLSGLAG